MALRPKTKPAQEETATVEETAPATVATTGPVAVAAQPAESQEADSDNSPRETLRWSKARTKALLALIAANTVIENGKARCTLTREEAATQLAAHPEFASVSDILLNPEKGPLRVGLHAGQLRRPVTQNKGGGLLGLPRFRSIGGKGGNREFYNPSNIANELAAEFSQFAAAPAVPDNQPTVAG